MAVLLALFELIFYALTTARKSGRFAARQTFSSVFNDEVREALGCGPSDEKGTEFPHHSPSVMSSPLGAAATVATTPNLYHRSVSYNGTPGAGAPDVKRALNGRNGHRVGGAQSEALLRKDSGKMWCWLDDKLRLYHTNHNYYECLCGRSPSTTTYYILFFRITIIAWIV